MGLFNRIIGSRKSYYKSGKLLSYTKINIKGYKHGIHEEFYESGVLKNQTQYKEGIQYGETKSFYDNGNKYREFNLINNEYEGEIKEYFKNGNLKFIKNKAKYTFFDEVQKHMLFDGNLSLVNGVWNSYRNDGTIEYQLDFEDKKEKVLKIIFTKSGEFYSKIHYDYKLFKGIHVNYSNEFAGQRLVSEIITKPSTIKGPPGIANGFTVNVRPIKSIEDIIKFI
jgi:antitoxin component YwqK of YwqJK toxin-antitoxin module